MSILVKDILKLSTLQEMKLLGGSGGLEKCIEWVYVSECLEDPLEGIKWLQGGEIVIITGVGIKSDVIVLRKLIEGISEKNGAALIINVGKYIREIPKEVVKKADELKLPLFTLPWEVRLVEVSKEISNTIILARIEEKFMNDFLNNVLFGQFDLGLNIKEKATYFGYNLQGKCCICIIEIDGVKEFAKSKNLDSEIDEPKIKLTLTKLIQNILEKYSLKVPIICNNNEIIFLSRTEENAMNRLNKALKEIKELIIKNMNGITINIAIGNGYEDLNLMKESFNEAKMVIESLKYEGARQVIRRYSDIGIYSLILSISNKNVMENYCKQIIGPIIEKNKNNKETSSVDILDMYLKENCNLTMAAEKLYLHRNTLTYRIKKIEQQLNCNLHNFEDCLKIKMALYISKIINL